MRTRPTPTLVATALVAGTLLVGPALSGPASSADLATCRGKTVTIAATDPVAPVSGTPGDDVVAVRVTRARSTTLSTGAGDDTVCLYGPAAAYVATGDGADVVDTTATTPAREPGLSIPSFSLGAGDDTFLGGPADEIVYDDEGGSSALADPGDDVIDTGPGNDQVSSYGGSDTITTGTGDDQVGALLGDAPDRVDLGDGNDRVELTGSPRSILEGGTGTDTMTLPVPRGATVIDNVVQSFTDGAGTTPFSSFEAFEVQVDTSLTFRGSERPELLTAVRSFTDEDRRTDHPRLDADMGGGDDGLLVDQAVVGTWSGGSGTDRLYHERNKSVPSGGRKPSLEVDLARGTAKVRGSSTARIRSWEELSVSYYSTASVTGSRRPDTISVAGCRTQVAGGAGRDVIEVSPSHRCGTPRTSTLRGGGGNDTITGDRGADRLFGDGGNDVLRGRGGKDAAFGGPGRDRCTAERRVSC